MKDVHAPAVINALAPFVNVKIRDAFVPNGTSRNTTWRWYLALRRKCHSTRPDLHIHSLRQCWDLPAKLDNAIMMRIIPAAAGLIRFRH